MRSITRKMQPDLNSLIIGESSSYIICTFNLVLIRVILDIAQKSAFWWNFSE